MASEVETYNCEHCGKEMQRLFIDFLQKYVWPICHCYNEIEERKIAASERLKRKNDLRRMFQHNIMNDNLREARFSNFEERNGTKDCLERTKDFAANFDKQDTGLILTGAPGNGKSHLAAAIHHHLDEQSYISLFLDCSQLFNIGEDAKKYSSKISISDIVNAAIACDLLTLDELGAGRLTQDEFTDILFPIINGRQGKMTNFTTNLNLDELSAWLATDKYGKPLDDKGRLIDRILVSCDILQNNGTSKRQEDALRRMHTKRNQEDQYG